MNLFTSGGASRRIEFFRTLIVIASYPFIVFSSAMPEITPPTMGKGNDTASEYRGTVTSSGTLQLSTIKT
ncbi:unnamed protein product [Soboliphyme baturini]|uniref:Secreted protein n=1 Tax=Soboliphyme baturini TaxID=241478 RepID=A0A183J696_9BILA|nr:unnamed protein product [Soboliphyme baturini]